MSDLAACNDLTLRLLKQWEKGPPAPWPRTPEGAALKAYQCSAGKWTVGWGCTRHPDGTKVKEGDTITPEQVPIYMEAALARVDADIDNVITVPMLPHQRAAVRSWIYNLGVGNLKATSEGRTQLLPKINAGRWRDAAAAMLVFVYSTGSKNGKPWKRAMFGLFNRRCCESCMMMGWDAAYACNPTRLSLPTQTEWQPEWVNPANGVKGRYYDIVLDGMTPFSNIERDAQNHPLSDTVDDLVLFDSDPIVFEPTTLPQDDVQLASAELEPAGAGQSSPTIPSAEAVPASTKSTAGASLPVGDGKEEVKQAPAAPPPAPVVKAAPVIAPKSVDVNAIPYGSVDPANGAKNITDSKRFAGMLIVGAGSAVQVLATRGLVTTTAGAVFYDFSRDPVLVALAVAGIFWAIAMLTKKRGTKVITTGMVNATSVLK